jgi:molybdenum cofactor synthesis domain-containing protein
LAARLAHQQHFLATGLVTLVSEPLVRVRRTIGAVQLEAKVLTVSDSVHAGRVEDGSGTALVQRLEESGYAVVERRVIPDGIDTVSEALRDMASGFAGVIVTTGGTGFGPRDLTPEGTLAMLERHAPGLSEAMRAVSPLGRLSRGAAGTVDRCLVLNTPGSRSGALESLTAVLDVLPHALDLLSGGQPHPHRGGSPVA